ncbi:MAG: NfeD family protein, partial [Novipirellula sp. JB048]
GGLTMEPPDAAAVSEAEKLADFSHLQGQAGVATTPLRPAGKARFGDQIVQVVSDGTPIASGDAVRVCEVHGTRVVVEALES